MRIVKAVIASLLIVSCIEGVASNSHAAAASASVQPCAATLGAQPDVVKISEDTAKALAARYAPAEVTSHMLHRWTTTLTCSQGMTGVKPNTTQVNQTGTWSGYEANETGTGRAVNVVAASMVAQRMGSNTAETASWVGIGGGIAQNSNLLQDGIDHSNLRGFWEIVPGNSPQELFPVNPGDTVYATVSLDSGDGLWYILVEDLNSSQYYANEISYSPDRSSAEWVTEATFGTFPHLNPSVNYTGAFWSYAFSSALPITSPLVATLYHLRENSGNGPNYCASAIGSDGESFNVYDC